MTIINLSIDEFNQDHKNDEERFFAELNQVPADVDDDVMDFDVPLDINCNHEKDAYRKKKHQIENALNQIKHSVDQAFAVIRDDDSDEANEDSGQSSNTH